MFLGVEIPSHNNERSNSTFAIDYTYPTCTDPCIDISSWQRRPFSSSSCRVHNVCRGDGITSPIVFNEKDDWGDDIYNWNLIEAAWKHHCSCSRCTGEGGSVIFTYTQGHESDQQQSKRCVQSLKSLISWIFLSLFIGRTPNVSLCRITSSLSHSPPCILVLFI